MADARTSPAESEPAEATLLFHEQADGRKVSRLAGGKVVLVDWDATDRVHAGEWWNVKLAHRETYAIATPVERARPELTNPVLPPAVAEALARTRTARPAPRADEAGRPATQPEARTPPITPSRVVGMNDRVALFVDGANMDLAARMAGYFVDYQKARDLFLAHGLFYAAYYYIADYTASDPQQQRYLDFLAHAGFIVRRKAVKAIRDQETGERILKANIDTELILDLINTAENYDLAFLLSGDSDFERAVDLLRSRGKRVYVVSTRKVLSRELLYVADKPVFFLEDFRTQLERDTKAPREP